MLEIGMTIADRYEIVSKVGAGGMSDVYKAKDTILGRYIAVKVLKPEFSEDRNFVTKFRTEAQSAAGLEHPNIVNIYDVGSENGIHYIVMEYVEGITLKTYVEKKGQLSFKESISIAIQVARGIEAAHNKHLIHRDIKPQNIIISTEGKVKVTDFGIARAASSNTISADVMGSVHYASPEQARNGFVDGRSDIYSLGIVMYEMVTGRVPYDGDTTVAVALQHLQEEMTPPSEYAPELPISMEKIILKCTQKNPDRRYQTIEELLNDLRRALLNPDEDFVVIAPLVDNGKTKVISEEELEQIKEQRGISADPDMDEEELDLDMENDEDADDEDEEEGSRLMNPKMEKAVNIMCAVIGVIILILIVYFILSIAGIFKTSGSKSDSEIETETETEQVRTVEMINIVGMTFEEAQEELDELGLTLVVGETRESDEEDGTILEQDVTNGTVVEEGTKVTVVVAGTDSANTVLTVPSVVGDTESVAKATLSAAGFTNVTTTYEYNSSVTAGNVISQTPTDGTTALADSEIALVISQGKESTEVPTVLNYDEETATGMLEEAGLTVVVEEEYSDSVSAGLVIRQSISGGKTVQQGTEVTITISLGTEELWYSCSTKVNITKSNATHVDVVLKDTSGNTLYSDLKVELSATQISNGYFTVTKSNLTVSAATIYVTFYEAVEVTEIDSETGEEIATGEVTYNEIGSNSYAASITKQDGYLEAN